MVQVWDEKERKKKKKQTINICILNGLASYEIFPNLVRAATICWCVQPSGTALACTTREGGALCGSD